MIHVSDLYDLGGRVALVTGAAGHLGRAIAESLAEAGASVVLNGRSKEPLEEFSEALRDRNLDVRTAAFDVNDAEAARTLLEGLERLDVLVNNAYSPRAGSLDTATTDDFLGATTVAVAAPFRLVQQSLPLLRSTAAAAGQSSIINIASMYGKVSPDPRLYGEELSPNPPFYGSAKAAVLQLTRYLACHLAPDNVRVNSISPGPFPTPGVQSDHPDFAQRLRSRVPLGRLGQPGDLKGATLFLASDASAYVTGIDLPVDGGWTAW